MVLALSGLPALPCLAAVDIELVPDDPSIQVGQITTVHLLARGTVGGIASAAGYVQATTSDGGGLSAIAGSFAWAGDPRRFVSSSPFPTALGQPGANGGWGTVGNRSTGFGSMQANYMAVDKTFGLGNYVELATYRVSGTAVGHVTLAICPDRIKGFRFVETTLAPVFGQNADATISIVPWATKPSGRWPSNGGIDVRTRSMLFWQGGPPGPGTSFDVYLDTVCPPVRKIAARQPNATFTVGSLSDATWYYWQVVTVDSGGSTAGPVWSFATHVPGDANGDGYVSIADLQSVVAAWGTSQTGGSPYVQADLNADGYVNIGDLQLLVANWGRSLN